MSFQKEEVLDEIQTSPICISLRRISISKQNKTRSFGKNHTAVKIGTEKSERVITGRVELGRRERKSQVRQATFILSCRLGRSVQPHCSVLPLSCSFSFADTWKQP